MVWGEDGDVDLVEVLDDLVRLDGFPPCLELFGGRAGGTGSAHPLLGFAISMQCLGVVFLLDSDWSRFWHADHEDMGGSMEISGAREGEGIVPLVCGGKLFGETTWLMEDVLLAFDEATEVPECLVTGVVGDSDLFV